MYSLTYNGTRVKQVLLPRQKTSYVMLFWFLFSSDLELDADGPSQGGNAPQAVRRSINLNLTKKSRMRTKSSSNKTSKSSRRERKSDRDGDGGKFLSYRFLCIPINYANFEKGNSKKLN